MTNWTTPRTWMTGELVTADDLNTELRDNLLFLRGAGAMQAVQRDVTYTISAPTPGVPTPWLDVDADDLTLTVTTTGGHILLGANLVAYSDHASNGPMQLDIARDGTRIGGDHGLAHVSTTLQSDYYVYQNPVYVHLSALQVGLPAGTYEFRLQWRVYVEIPPQGYAWAPTVSIYNTADGGIPVQFYAMEIPAQ
jgi:hypothetical protein